MSRIETPEQYEAARDALAKIEERIVDPDDFPGALEALREQIADYERRHGSD